MKITIVGTGYVGLVTGACLAEVYDGEVTCLDIDESKINNLKQGIIPFYESGLDTLINKNIKNNKLVFTTNYKEAYKNSDIIMIAVGTPQNSDGSANLKYILACSDQIASIIEKETLIVIKSTVPPGTSNYIEDYINKQLKNGLVIEVASNPEFLSQGSAVNDTLRASRIVIGTKSKYAEEKLMELYKNFKMPIVCVNRESSEMIKYASNCFLALKVSYINDIANLCEIVKANIDDVVKGMQYDSRIGEGFLKPGIGYGGSCFPKDTNALYHIAKSNNYELKTVYSTIETNNKQIYRLIDKADFKINTFKNLNVTILGITFKPGTDDLRDAPSIKNIKYLLENGANVKVYDPIGLENCKSIFKDKVSYANSIDEAIRNSEICFIMTEWSEIVNYKLNKYKVLMKNPIVFDGRNCYDLEKAKEAGIEYYSIGR